MATPPQSVFDGAYESNTAPWVIGEPQPEVVMLEKEGWITGSVLDPGCGTGEHTIHLARQGYEVRGIDYSERAVEQARANAAEQGVDAAFAVADAFALEQHGSRYDTIIDSALFHIFEGSDRAAYVASLYAACRPGGVVHVLALSDTEPGIGPRISDTTIREAFGTGWQLESLRAAHYRVTVGKDEAAYLGLNPGDTSDESAWLARIRRL